MRKIDIDEAEKILGLTGEYGEAELKAAHRRMIAEYHPDRFATQPDTMKRLATEKLQEVNEANSVLKKEVSNGRRRVAGTSTSPSYNTPNTSSSYSSSHSSSYQNDYQRTSADSYDPSYDYIPEFIKSNPSTSQSQSQSQSYDEPYTPTTTTTTRKVHTFGWKKVVAIIIALFLVTEIGGCVVSSFIEQHQKEEQAAIFDQMVEIVDYGFSPINNDETSFGVEVRNKSDKYILTGAEVHVTFYDIAGNKLYSHNYITGGIALPGETVMAGDEPSVSNVARMECELVKGSVTFNTNEDNQYKAPLVVEDVSLTPDNDRGTRQSFSAVVKNPNDAAFTKAKVVVTYRNAENHPVYIYFLKLNGNWAANGEDSFSQPITSPPTGQWEYYTIQASPLI